MGKLNMLQSYEYEPNDVENELMLSELPLSLMMETIQEQFRDPLEYRKQNYVQSFFNKYKYSKENITQDGEEELEELYVKFISFMEKMFKKFLGIGLPNIDDDGEEDQEELIHFIYRYFILNIRKNFVNFIFNYIEDNKEGIVANLEKKKDVTVLSLKDHVTDENDIAVISNITDLIEDILEQEFSIDDFFKYSKTDSTELDIEFVSDKFDSFDITGNFVPHYFQMVDEDLKVELECKIRNKILKKYK